MPNSVPSSNGERVAQAAARKFGLDLQADPTGFADARYKSNGRKVQIKSALKERADGPGVFRVWRRHLRALERANGSVLVGVVNPSNDHRKVLKVAKVSPRTLLDVGEFRRSRQSDMAGKYEARIPWRDVVSL